MYKKRIILLGSKQTYGNALFLEKYIKVFFRAVWKTLTICKRMKNKSKLSSLIVLHTGLRLLWLK